MLDVKIMEPFAEEPLWRGDMEQIPRIGETIIVMEPPPGRVIYAVVDVLWSAGDGRGAAPDVLIVVVPPPMVADDDPRLPAWKRRP